MSSPTTLVTIGGNGGGPFSFTGEKSGASLEKIWVWVGEWQVKAVKVWLSDGTSQEFGIPAGSYQEYLFKPGECFTFLSLWANEQDNRLGAIKFQTNMGGSFFAKMTSQLPKEIPIDVGSGYCLGVAGRCGFDIDRMGFMFLDAVQSAVLTNVNYPTITQLKPNVTEENIESITYTNDSSINQEENIKASKKVTKQSSWSISESFTATFNLSVKAGIPELAEVSSGYSVIVGAQSTYCQEQTEESTETLSTNAVVPPKKKVDVHITIGTAPFDLPYTGTVKITCKNGGVWQYETHGQYKGTTYTNIIVKTTESNL